MWILGGDIDESYKKRYVRELLSGDGTRGEYWWVSRDIWRRHRQDRQDRGGRRLKKSVKRCTLKYDMSRVERSEWTHLIVLCGECRSVMLLPHKPRVCHTHQVLCESPCLVCADESAGAECFDDV